MTNETRKEAFCNFDLSHSVKHAVELLRTMTYEEHIESFEDYAETLKLLQICVKAMITAEMSYQEQSWDFQCWQNLYKIESLLEEASKLMLECDSYYR